MFKNLQTKFENKKIIAKFFEDYRIFYIYIYLHELLNYKIGELYFILKKAMKI